MKREKFLLGYVVICMSFLLTLPLSNAQGAGFSLRFHGNGVEAPDQDRVKIQIDDPTNSNPGPPADIGATDFTLEFWMKANQGENTAGAVTCGNNINWINGNIIFDRDRFNQDRKFGLSIAGGMVVFGVSGDGTGDRTICGTSNVLDEQWHHIAVQRKLSDGSMSLYVDGVLEARADTGPGGDISYPDDGVPGNFCGGPCTNSDPFLVIGAEKHDAGAAFPSYSGWIDEVRLSNIIRYSSNFTRPSQPFTPDADTVGLYHFDEGNGNDITDSSSGGSSNGTRNFGGDPAGPEWSTDLPPFGGPSVIAFQEIATGLANPVAITHAGDGSGRLFIVEQAGRIRIYNGTPVLSTFLDISPSGLNLVLNGGERGLLSVAFHPDYPTTPFFFVFYTAMNGDLVIARYSVSVDPNVADPNSATILLAIPHSAGNHNGGQLQFGPDGFLYISTGDGAAPNNAQSLNSLLGKILRIDVDTGSPYGIPTDNPFVETPDDPNTLGEIWALGFRNPWRFSFDRVTGDLFTGDVGQGSWEEVNFRPATSSGGENYQWSCREGNHSFDPDQTCPDGTSTPPILEYSHSFGCSITGGYRYRGTQFPQGHGTYFYGDFCSGLIWGGIQNSLGGWVSTEPVATDLSVSTFGEDDDGELYVADYGGGAIYRITNNTTPVTLTVITAGSGTGTVTSAPPGIECGTGGTDCSEVYTRGAVVMLIATPDPGFILTNWSGAPDCTDGVVTLNADTTCTANFARGPDLIGQLGQLTKKIKKTTDELKFVVTVQNVGDLPFTIKPLVHVFLSDDDILDASDTLVFEKKAQPKKLFPGGVEFIKGKAKVPTPAQGQFLILKIDPTNLITESDEGNNLATLQIP